ncbi:hypothetical protein [Flavobacterium sp. 3HN19-14]|uniref:hypothetical protein n=1 Tax=Flavobacterium sp. 3HN19-14 TaxID=3448133 RepID=UPI003EE0B3E5
MNKCLLLILLGNFALAQTTAKIQVKTNGFNKIVISPELRALSKTDLSDLRIYDAKNHEIPYLRIEENDSKPHYDFEEYPIFGKMIDEKDSTSMVVENPMKEINSLTLFIANTSVNKTYNLYGSNDYKSWFGISQKQKLEDLSENSNAYVIKTIVFPRCTYRFLRIVFNNKKTLPINVLHIGNLKPAAKNGIDLLPAVPDYSTVSNVQGSKKTVIAVRYKNPTIINKMVFHISGQRYYNRKVNIYKNVTVTRKRKKHVVQGRPDAV